MLSPRFRSLGDRAAIRILLFESMSKDGTAESIVLQFHGRKARKRVVKNADS